MTIFISPAALSLKNENIIYQINQIISTTNHTPQITQTALHTKLIQLAVENHNLITGLIITNPKTGNIETLCVHPTHQNKGIGKILLTRTLHPYTPITHPFENFSTLAPKTNQRIITLLKKNNFIEHPHKDPTYTKLIHTNKNKP